MVRSRSRKDRRATTMSSVCCGRARAVRRSRRSGERGAPTARGAYLAVGPGATNAPALPFPSSPRRAMPGPDAGPVHADVYWIMERDSSYAATPPPPPPPWLLGRWRLVHAAPALGFIPGTRMEFVPDGTLRYVIPIDGGEQTIDLLYRVENDLLRTENPLAPHSTGTPIRQGPGDTLVLDFADSPAVLVRERGDLSLL